MNYNTIRHLLYIIYHNQAFRKWRDVKIFVLFTRILQFLITALTNLPVFLNYLFTNITSTKQITHQLIRKHRIKTQSKLPKYKNILQNIEHNQYMNWWLWKIIKISFAFNTSRECPRSCEDSIFKARHFHRFYGFKERNGNDYRGILSMHFKGGWISWKRARFSSCGSLGYNSIERLHRDQVKLRLWYSFPRASKF